ncbi:hypothetical protein [Mesoplasma lactucae]|uniref:Uncharacterized protein n=1 Tax=Mesoplasma lactucae ATCC 49193 TaxID=81460 RepID=A0A291IR72_9MOLU|nr:hypothetical protein [Mesoplasma lactucae]ATG97238.1 hypothetical protein CP520_00470 [Mesoplasma lactucae ATCC 49193]ATZ20318.1 hypothetical protein MLACT_v1c04970 [Mesoplasma lactucae ATCC 49193]MCL8216489.1 hypothetical protein [Mesoplasma lactucae ATCC 49193]
MADNKNQKTASEHERIWVKQFNKYLDELTIDEWNAMANSSCGDINRTGYETKKDKKKDCKDDPTGC